MEVARRQGARLFELRATGSLARLLKQQGKRDEARAILAEIYGWFTESFDTPDLKDAKALLDQLNDRRWHRPVVMKRPRSAERSKRDPRS
jgi:predicted ATPase